MFTLLKIDKLYYESSDKFVTKKNVLPYNEFRFSYTKKLLGDSSIMYCFSKNYKNLCCIEIYKTKNAANAFFDHL